MKQESGRGSTEEVWGFSCSDFVGLYPQFLAHLSSLFLRSGHRVLEIKFQVGKGNFYFFFTVGGGSGAAAVGGWPPYPVGAGS